jgi:hypothetical protein
MGGLGGGECSRSPLPQLNNPAKSETLTVQSLTLNLMRNLNKGIRPMRQYLL